MLSLTSKLQPAFFSLFFFYFFVSLGSPFNTHQPHDLLLEAGTNQTNNRKQESSPITPCLLYSYLTLTLVFVMAIHRVKEDTDK